MPSPVTHAFVGASLSATLPEGLRKIPVAAGCALLAASPDLDIIGFFLGVPYSSTFGHRGITHGLPAACLVAAGISLAAYCTRKTAKIQSFQLFVGLAVILGSHGVLDMATNGGLGVGLLAPWWGGRLFLPFRPIEVSPINPSRLVTEGLPVISTELLWIWTPGIACVTLIRFWRSYRSRRPISGCSNGPDRSSSL